MKLLTSLLLTMALASGVSAQKHEPRPLCLTQSASPMGLVKCLTDYNSDLLLSAKVKNSSQAPIASYRIGWMTFLGLGKTRVSLGGVNRGDKEIAPGQTASVPAQAVSPSIGKDASAIAFFVAEIHFANGDVWNADLKTVTREAKTMKKKPPIGIDEYSP